MAGRKKEEAAAGSRLEEEISSEKGRITVRICSREYGLERYENVKFIRVVSKRYNLLIMADYMPMIGDLEGSVFFIADGKEYKREHLKGYFMHKKNEFSLMLEKEGAEETEPAQEKAISEEEA